ncbi:MAG: hypothetical protein AB1297_00600, partial [bacterium]
MKYIIDSPNKIIKSARNIPQTEKWHWCYFGVDMTKRHKIELELSSSRRYYYAKEIRKLSHEMKTPFLDGMASINSNHKDSLKWWATRLPSKSVLQTDFFLLLCYFNLIRKWCIEGLEINGTLLIAVGDPFLLKMLKMSLGNKKGVYVGSPQLDIMKYKIVALIRMVLVRGWFIFKCAIMLFNDFVLKIQYREKYYRMISYNPDVLTCTWVENRCFKQGEFKDMYLGDLLPIYRERNFKAILTTLTGLTYSLKKQLLKLKEDIIIISFFLKFKDCLKATFSIPINICEREKMIFCDYDYSLLFIREYLLEIGSLFHISNLLEYYAYKNYFAKQKDKKLFIYPFENQPWEKMVLLAIKDSGISIRTAGYQHSSVPEMLLTNFLGKNEAEVMPLPDNL